jgi:hypothetical protein
VLLLPAVNKAVSFRVSVTVRSPPNRLQASRRGSCHMQAELQVKRLYTAPLAAVPLVYRTWCRTFGKPTHLLAWPQQHGWWACNRDERIAGTKVNSMPAVLLASQRTYTYDQPSCATPTGGLDPARHSARCDADDRSSTVTSTWTPAGRWSVRASCLLGSEASKRAGLVSF